MNETAYRNARSFLSSQGMLHESYDLHTLVKTFIGEMERGLAGGESSLAMIPTYFSSPRTVPEGEDITVIDAGGTRLRRGIVRFSGTRADIREFMESEMPGTRSSVDASEFLEKVAGFVSPVLPFSQHLGFCFSYPILNNPAHDAMVLSMSKELKIRGIENLFIGKELFSRLQSDDGKWKGNIAVLNDTVAVFLAGWFQAGPEAEETGERIHIGYILGTGVNCCYEEVNGAVAVYAGDRPADFQLINTESGGYRPIPKGSADEALDKKTIQPNLCILEKMTSGAYLGPLFLEVLKIAASSRLFGKTSQEGVRALETLQTEDLSFLLAEPDSCSLSRVFSQSRDLDTARYLAELLIRRAALVASIPLTAVIEKRITDSQDTRFSGVTVSVEGSTFFKIPGYREQITRYISEYAAELKNLSVKIQGVENGSLIGAGIAALSER